VVYVILVQHVLYGAGNARLAGRGVPGRLRLALHHQEGACPDPQLFVEAGWQQHQAGRAVLKLHLYYITLHYITLHYITLHYITLHYITLHYITLHYITLQDVIASSSYIILYFQQLWHFA